MYYELNIYMYIIILTVSLCRLLAGLKMDSHVKACRKCGFTSRNLDVILCHFKD